MGNYFNEVVDRAIEDLYYCCDNDKAKAAAVLCALRMDIVTPQFRELMPFGSIKES